MTIVKCFFSLSFPTSDGTVKIDLIVASPFGIMVVKVLDWCHNCDISPRDKWTEKKLDGTVVEHNNQLSELDRAAQWVRVFLESKNACPKLIATYVLFPSPHVKPVGSSDPRIIIGPSSCRSLITSHGLNNELSETKSYLEWGQGTIAATVNKLRGESTTIKQEADGELWERMKACFSQLPQYDLLFLRRNGCYVFGHFERFEDVSGENSARSLAQFCSRGSHKILGFEHSAGGVLGAPLALISGGLGLEPTCRVRILFQESKRDKSAPALEFLDVPPATRIIFRAYGGEGFVSAEANDVDILELSRVAKSLEEGPDMVDQLGQMLGDAFKKSLQVGVKKMLPFPFNNM